MYIKPNKCIKNSSVLVVLIPFDKVEAARDPDTLVDPSSKFDCIIYLFIYLFIYLLIKYTGNQ